MVGDGKADVVVLDGDGAPFRFVQQGAVAHGGRGHCADVRFDGNAGMAGVGDVVHNQDVPAGDAAGLQRAERDVHRAGRLSAGAVAAGAQVFYLQDFSLHSPRQVGCEHRGAFEDADQYQPQAVIIAVNLRGQPGEAIPQLGFVNQDGQAVVRH